MNWTIGQVADALGASFAGGDGRVSGYSINSRSLNKGEMFFAVRAERDGHDFVAGAFGQGASAAVVALDWPVPRGLAGKALLRVGDPRQALADLARAQRRAWGSAESDSSSAARTSNGTEEPWLSPVPSKGRAWPTGRGCSGSVATRWRTRELQRRRPERSGQNALPRELPR